MDATQLRSLVESALAAQVAYDAAEAAIISAENARTTAREKLAREVTALQKIIRDGCVLYGDKIVRVRVDNFGVVAVPLHHIALAAPPPLPEADPPTDRRALTPQDFAETAINRPKPAAPLSGGKVPPPKK